MCMGVWLACMSVHPVHAWCHERPKVGFGTGVVDGCELPSGCSELNKVALEEQPPYLSTEPSTPDALF